MSTITDDLFEFRAAADDGDFDDSGGLPGSRVIEFNAENGLFRDLVPLDGTGVVNASTFYAFVVVDSAEPLLRPYSYVARPPAAAGVSVALVPSGEWGERRASLRARVEADLARAVRYPGALLEAQSARSETIQIYQRPEVPLPAVGASLALVYHEGQSDEHEQVVRLLSVSSVRRTLYPGDANGGGVDFLILTCDIDQPLDRAYSGGAVVSRGTPGGDTVLRETRSTGASRLYGIQPLSAAVDLGADTVQVPAVRVPACPASRSEKAVPSFRAAGAATQLVQAGAVHRLATGVAGSVVQLARGLTPGSVTITGSATLVDQGDGTATGAGLVAQIDYRVGKLLMPMPGAWNVDAAPAGEASGAVETAEIPVTDANRGTTWAWTADPPPAPGTTTVRWVADGEPLALAANAADALMGDGGGKVTAATGDILPTLAAAPDPDTAVVFAWGVRAEYTRRDGGALALDARYAVQLPPGLTALAATWTSGGQARALAVAADGTVSGHATGRYVASSGMAVVTWQYLPDPGTAVHWSGQIRTALSGSLLAASDMQNPSVLQITIPAGDPLRPGSVTLTVREVTLTPPEPTEGTLTLNYERQTFALADNGAGRLLWGAVDVGAIDYATRIATIDLPDTVSVPGWTTVTRTSTWGIGQAFSAARTSQRRGNYAAAVSIPPSVVVDWSVVVDLPAEVWEADTDAGPITITLPQDGEPGIGGSLAFELSGEYYWTQGAAVYRSLNAAAGSGIAVGTWDAVAGRVTITARPNAAVSGGTLRSLLTAAAGARPLTDVVGYIPGAPCKPGVSLLRATATDGATLSVLIDANSEWHGAFVRGSLQPQTGLYRLHFGAYVADASLSADEKLQPWYDASLVVNGQIWKPRSVLADSVEITTVVYQVVPLSGDRVGMSGTRFQPDGTLRAFRAGDSVIAHHTGEFTGGTPAAGTVINFGRTRIGSARVLDGDGRRVSSALYALDRAAGTLTWASPLDLGGHVGPFTYQNTIFDILGLAEAPISGRLRLTGPLSHAYPLGSYISSLQEHGPAVQARASRLRYQPAWLGWDGEGESAWTYDAARVPIEVTGAGAVEESWRIELSDATGHVRVYGRKLGLVAQGLLIDTDIAPQNTVVTLPDDSHPVYFRMRAAGFSQDRTPGRQILFDTHPTGAMLQAIRVVSIGGVVEGADGCEIRFAGGVDA